MARLGFHAKRSQAEPDDRPRRIDGGQVKQKGVEEVLDEK